MSKTDPRRALLHPYQQTRKAQTYIDRTRPLCIRCREARAQADGFCKQCWYPDIEQDWKHYQLLLNEGYGDMEAGLESGVWSYSEMIQEK